VSSELRGHGYGSDQPRETGTGTDRDITEVPAYAGSDTGITREDIYAELHGAGRDHGGAADGRTTNGSADADHGNAGADGSDSGRDHGNASADRPANGADGGAAPEGRDGGASAGMAAGGAWTHEQTGAVDTSNGRDATAAARDGSYSDDGTHSAATDADKTGGGTQERLGLADNAEATGPGPTVRIPAEAGFRGQNAADLSAPERGIRVSNPDGQATGGPGRDDARGAGSHDTGTVVLQDRDEGDTGKRSRTGPDAAEPPGQRADTAGAETAERKGKDQPARPESAPDASPDQPGETAAEVSPDQHGGDQRLAAVEQRLEAAMEERLQTALDGVKANYDAKIEDLKAEYESKMNGLKTGYEADKAQLQQEIGNLTAEVETLKADRQPAREVPGKPNAPASGELDNQRKPDADPEPARARNKELNTSGKAEMRDDPGEDRPGWWSNAKAGLYGAVGSTAVLAGADQFIPGAPHAVIDLIVGGVTIAATAVPVRREGWKKKHGD
jgi:hypothetical protein